MIREICKDETFLAQKAAPATAAAAMAGRKPARTIRVTIVGPTAAQRPAKDEMATEMKPVTIMQQGRSRTPSVRRGFVKSDTR